MNKTEKLQHYLKNYPKVIVLGETAGNKYTELDLSINNSELNSDICSNSTKLGTYINHVLERTSTQMAYGGYDEERAIYRRSNIFNDNESEERNIHIGLDLWAEKGTDVFAAFDGKVHSLAFNKGEGNYGPTIILQHSFDDYTFYTLYGHLDEDCLAGLHIGDEIFAGQKIGVLGDESVNGDYPAHLHFQIISDIGSYVGDYPGVCTKSERDYYLENCPNPNLLLKINI